MKKNIYEIITARIEELLNQGTIPWHQPWKPGAGEHRNLISKKPYRGINVFLLGCAGFTSPYWLTFKQAKELGGSIKKGEKGNIVVFWKWLFKEEEQENGEIEEVKIPMLRYYTVFNVDQCEGIPADKIPALDDNTNTLEPIEAAEQLINSMPLCPSISYGGNRAFYSPSADRVQLPALEQYDVAEEYYSTAFHELAHSTGHKSRLNRKEITSHNPFGSKEYSKEELIAEMTASYLCAVTGIEQATIENSAAYIQGWLKKLKDDRKMIVYAAAAAQKAADFIRGIEAQTQPATNQHQKAA